MAADPNTLPLLLVGPVLRRVEADLVSVFVATSRPCAVTLHVWNGTRDAPAAGTLPQTDASYVSAAQTTRALGPRLHVLVVVLDLRVPGGNATHGAGALTAGGEYAYDLVFDAGDGTPRDLATLGLLAAADPARHFVPLGYDTNRLPTFLTPPSEADKLVLLHGSCRRMFDGWPIDDDLTLRDGAGAAIEPEAWQPPAGWAPPRPSFADPFADSRPGSFPDDALPTGPKIDGLRWVDALIDNGRRGLGWEKRPHQLFLTGDQVYADDVPAVFIAALNHLGRLLVGSESLPWLKRKKNGTQRRDDQPAEPDASAADLDHFPPGERRRLVLELGGFSTSDGESHLLSFGEFAAYYLLTWSPELWAWPGVFPTPQDYGKPAGSPLYEHEAPATWLEAVSADERAALDAYALEHPSPQIPAAHAGVDEDARAGWLYGRISARNQQYDVNAANFAFRSWRFRRDLARVRRALANVPTYMVMDDHEVTDDWYTSRRWRDQVYSRPLGVATVRNGLAAYSAFQAWGNDPRAFAAVGGEERTLLDRIVSWAAAPSPNPGTTSPTQDALQASLGLPHAAAGPASTFRPLVSFSYVVEGPAHRVLVLDGRTCRRFPTRRAIAGCLDYVGPDGLFSSSPMGRALPPRPANDEKLVFVVAAIPVLGPDVMELVLVPFQRLTRLGSSIDAEAWAYEPGTYEALLWALGRYQRVVLLSGDIHMGFSVALDHWAKLPGDAVRPARIVQLTASGLTQDWGSKTGIFSQNALGQEILQAVTLEGAPAERVGWGRPVLLAPGTPEPLGSLVDTGTARAHPALQERLDGPTKAVPTRGWPAGAHEAREPNWAWRCSMVRDVRPEGTSAPEVDGKRWTPLLLPDEPLGSATGPGADWHAQALFRLRFGRVFAYQPHVGVVTLRKRDNQWSVRHVLAGELPPASVAASIGSPAPVVPAGVLPWVVHEASLEPPAASVWDTPERPTVKGGEAWGVDPTDSSIDGLLYYIPKLWAWALGRLGQIVPPLPLGA
ncbi:MAG: hypothetical protein MUF34_10965, partial [Polyangiaceae bacterium]|nr:hypothetical protein [Polyangiaceae bacterium]